MLAGGGNRLSASVDAGYRKAQPRHRFGDQAAPASDIEQVQAGKGEHQTGGPTKVVRQPTTNIAEPRWIELVQRAEIALRLPPYVCLSGKFRNFIEIDSAVAHVQGLSPIYWPVAEFGAEEYVAGGDPPQPPLGQAVSMI